MPFAMRAAVPLLLLCLSGLRADEPLRLKETFAPGRQFHVWSKMDGTGTFSLPPDKDGKKPESLKKEAGSDIEYLERVLETDSDGLPNRMLRVYEKIDFRKKLDGQLLKNTVRDQVRRLVLLRDREKNLKVPFSPDGPLLLDEIELVRSDVFTPALSGLLPTEAVKPGDQWKASAAAVRELTDMQVEEGELTCKFAEVATQQGRRVAFISVRGQVRGVSEDGPVRHALAGHFFFDLQSNHISYLTLGGKQMFLDKEGKEAGVIEGTLTITRRLAESPKLADEATRSLKLVPDEDNTLLMYDNDDLGVRFLYPRRWRVGTQGRQVTIDADEGNGILLTRLSPAEVPSPSAYAKEAQDFIRGQGGKIYGTRAAKQVQRSPEVYGFGFEAEMKGQRVVLDYFISTHRAGGATLAARLTPEALKDLRPEAERIARSVVVTK